jgi:hypothetical protein
MKKQRSGFSFEREMAILRNFHFVSCELPVLISTEKMIVHILLYRPTDRYQGNLRYPSISGHICPEIPHLISGDIHSIEATPTDPINFSPDIKKGERPFVCLSDLDHESRSPERSAFNFHN